jgi:transcriptional regulator with XRE-family HTH domain
VRNKIKAMREARALSLETLAERVGTTNQQMSHLENGKRRLIVERPAGKKTFIVILRKPAP